MPLLPVHGAGNDDDLEGNWAADDGAAAELPPGDAKAKSTKKKKSSAKVSEPAASKKRKKAAPAEPAAPEPKAKKRRKKRRDDAEDGEPDAEAGGQEIRSWAAGRLEAAWAAEAKARSLAPLEAQELSPAAAWFAPCPPATPLAQLPGSVAGDAAGDDALRMLRAMAAAPRKGKGDAKLPAPKPQGASVLVLCLSTERVFGALDEIKASWGSVRPLPLAAHGGGRRKDQVARQAKALEAGVAVAIGTPGRSLRLLDEGHVSAGSLEAIVLDLARDRKQNDLLKLRETRRELFELLQRHLLPLLDTGSGPRILLCGSGATVAGG